MHITTSLILSRQSGCDNSLLLKLLQPGMSTLEALRMSRRMISEGIPSATSLLVSGCGHTRCGKQDGQTTDRSGPGAAHANLSARQAKELGLLTSGTFGLPSSTSSSSAALQSCLESRLRAKLSSLGSTLYKLTWKPWVTPLGVCRSRLRASVRRTSETGLIGWPTPRASEAEHSGRKAGTGHKGQVGLAEAASLAVLSGWCTPTATDAMRGSNPPRPQDTGVPLSQQVAGGRTSPTNGFWRDVDWLFCRDGKWRPTQPDIFPLAPRTPQHVGLLRGAGNAINAEAAKIFIQVFIETQGANQ